MYTRRLRQPPRGRDRASESERQRQRDRQCDTECARARERERALDLLRKVTAYRGSRVRHR